MIFFGLNEKTMNQQAKKVGSTKFYMCDLFFNTKSFKCFAIAGTSHRPAVIIIILIVLVLT